MVELSIVVPIYNVEQYLEECLKSIYKLDIKKEIILVNDESPDNSNKIMEKYKKLYPMDTIIINQKNKGLSGARNSGLKVAKGKYIAFIDSDDFIDTKKYEEFFNKGKHKKLDILIGTYQKYDGKKYLDVCKRDKKINNLGVITGKEFFEKSMELNSFREEIWDDIYNREFLISNNLEFKEGLLHEDVLFFIQALIKAEKVEYLDIPFYVYRQREGSIMSSLSEINYQHKLYIVNELMNLQKEINLKKLNSYLLGILWSIFRNGKKTNKKLLKELRLLNNNYTMKDYIKLYIMFMSCSKNESELKEITWRE